VGLAPFCENFYGVNCSGRSETTPQSPVMTPQRDAPTRVACEAMLGRIVVHVRTSQPAGAAVKPNFPSAAASLTNTSGASSMKASIASYGPGP
jgi:hypothetical protein